MCLFYFCASNVFNKILIACWGIDHAGCFLMQTILQRCDCRLLRKMLMVAMMTTIKRTMMMLSPGKSRCCRLADSWAQPWESSENCGETLCTVKPQTALHASVDKGIIVLLLAILDAFGQQTHEMHCIVQRRVVDYVECNTHCKSAICIDKKSCFSCPSC